MKMMVYAIFMCQRKEFIMNQTRNLGQEKISKLLLAFSLPCIISMVVNSIYNIVDQIFIGQGVGYLGNAATNVIFPLVIMCNAFAGLLGNGAAANLSLRLGEKKEKEASKSVGSTITFTLIFSILLSILFYFLLPVLIKAFGCTEKVYPYALEYGKIILLGAPFMICYTTLSSLIRADGSPKYSMILLLVGAIINIILDAIFILGFDMGVKGGALATIIGQMASFILACSYIKRFKTIKLEKSDYKIDRSVLKVMGYGLSSFITQMTILALFVFMNNMMTYYGSLSKFGSDIPLSVYGIISKLNSLYVSSVLGIAIGAQPIIGFNYGAGNAQRVKEALRKVVFVNLIIGICFNLCFLLFPRELISLFGSSDNHLYVSFALDCCRIFLMVCFLNSFEMSTSIVVQSLGNVKKATAVSFIRQIILFIPLALLFSHFFGLYGTLYAGPVADTVCFFAVLYIFITEYRKIGIVKKEKEEEKLEFTATKKIKLRGKQIITINREYGSGGRYVGQILSSLLDIPFYDKKLISLTAKESGFTEEYIKENEQKKKTTSSEYNSDDKIFIAESKVIENLSKDSCVIVGRCADYILKNKKNVTRIFLYSSKENKIKRAVKYYHVEKEKADRKIRKINKDRAKHYEYYTGEKWNNLANYDLALNVDSLGVEKTAELIQTIILNKK